MFEDYSIFWSFFKLILALPAVLLLVYISFKFQNQYLSKINQGKNIQIIEKVPLHNKSFLCVVKIGKDYMALGVTENKIEVIKTLLEDEVQQVHAEGLDPFKKALESNYMKWKRKKGEQ